MNEPGQVGPAWNRVLKADRPVVLECYTDPDVPPMPPHVSVAQAKSYLMAILKGDVDAPGVISHSLRDFVDQMLPHKDDR